MDHLASEYTGPAVLVLPSAEIPAHADLQAWHGVPAGVDEHGDVVISLDPPAAHWAGTITVTPDPAEPMPLITDAPLRLRLPDGTRGDAEMEALEWTGEHLVIAIVGQGDVPF